MPRHTTFVLYFLVAITFIILASSVSVNAFAENSDLAYDDIDTSTSANLPYQDLETIAPEEIEASSDEAAETTEQEIEGFYCPDFPL
ncbi:8494_t:CDS:2 [Cetraspora pellucida]|uniref:8494_t:CDS:1 n=1 Tax=Cetraspora pellucida TaxID=1433469 RepID=A0ACA9LJW5_9GLOM|nr:8494_t:CDS:2 [Cetraspora pellucida]